jgi:flagellin-like hook-associated protein FlgL
VEIANRKHNGKYIFSGTDTSTIPFVVERDADGYIINVKYQGDTNPIYREVDEGVLIQINTIGDDLFTAIPQKVKMGYDGVDNPTLPLAKYLTERPYTTGVFRINEKEIFYDITKDSLEDIRDKINGAKCGVTATIERDPGPPDVPAPYRLVLEANDPCARAAIWMEDLWERADPLLNDLMFVDPDNPNPPNNIHPGAEVLTNPDSLPTYEEKPHYFFFNALINLREALRDNDSLEIQDGITEIDFSIENKLVHRARIGATINRMENIRTRLRSRRLNTQELLSKIEDADMTDVIMRLRMQETIHQAALASGARLIHPTLMDFL